MCKSEALWRTSMSDVEYSRRRAVAPPADHPPRLSYTTRKLPGRCPVTLPTHMRLVWTVFQ
jgi:hypothetical protein